MIDIQKPINMKQLFDQETRNKIVEQLVFLSLITGSNEEVCNEYEKELVFEFMGQQLKI